MLADLGTAGSRRLVAAGAAALPFLAGAGLLRSYTGSNPRFASDAAEQACTRLLDNLELGFLLVDP
jgi:hypothetical protein